MAEITLWKDDKTGDYKIDLNVQAPYVFHVKAIWQGKEWFVKNFDVRKFDTEAKVIPEAEYRLGIKPRPLMVTGHDYTEEQIMALRSYEVCRNHLNDAIYLVNLGVDITAGKYPIDIKDLREEVVLARDKCIDMGIEIGI